MNLGSISDQLPTYPNNIQGELRIILQTKDIFLVCYKHLEEYRRLVNEQNRLITKEFVQEQLQIGEDEIAELKMELQDAEGRLGARLRHNELLADHLASLGYASLESGASVRHLALCRSPQMRKNMLAQRQGGGPCSARLTEPRPPTHMIDNIALAIAEIHQEVRAKVKPLLDYYRDLFYLQLHFSLVLGQVCNYCMPLVTENIGLIDRIFFWSERPEFDLVRRAGDIGDRLKEIYTRAQTVLGVLAESVRFLQSKVELQKTLETRFHERLDEQQKTKDKILREVHTTKQNMDMLEEENDRLVGSLVKVDPSFVDSRHFYELAEGGNLLGAKKSTNGLKDTAQNNAEDKTEPQPSMHSQMPRQESNDEGKNVNASNSQNHSAEKSNPVSIELAAEDMNNNKAISVAGSVSPVVIHRHSTESRRPRENRNAGLKSSKTKLSTVDADKLRSSKRSKPKGLEFIDTISPTNDTTEITEIDDDQTPTPPRSIASRASSRVRGRSRRRESGETGGNVDKEVRKQSRRRAVSVERREKKAKPRQHRSTSKTPVTRKPRTGEDVVNTKRLPSSHNLEKDWLQRKTSTTTSTSGGNVGVVPTAVTPSTLKSRLLGRTRDLLEAALHKVPKYSSSETASQNAGDMDSSLATGRMDPDEMNNDGVTSVSSFASLLVPDSVAADAGFTSPSSDEMKRQSGAGNKKSSNQHQKSQNTGLAKTKSTKRMKSNLLDVTSHKQLPLLSTDLLLTEGMGGNQAVGANLEVRGQKRTPPRRKSSKTRRGGGGKGASLVDFLAGGELSPLEAASPTHLALPTFSNSALGQRPLSTSPA